MVDDEPTIIMPVDWKEPLRRIRGSIFRTVLNVDDVNDATTGRYYTVSRMRRVRTTITGDTLGPAPDVIGY